MGFFFRSQGNPKVGSAVEEFNAIVTGRIAALAEQLAQCPAEEAEALTRQALELMLFYPIPQDNTISFSLTAFEGHARPLVDFLPPEVRQETAKRYAKRTPPPPDAAQPKEAVEGAFPLTKNSPAALPRGCFALNSLSAGS